MRTAISARCRNTASSFRCWQQIDEEMRSTYPAILGEHPLLHWWGFKYDSQLKGINIHADFRGGERQFLDHAG